MNIYFDESIHTRGDFIVLAGVVADSDVIKLAEEALVKCGYTPGLHEFKSSMKMQGNQNAQRLREEFQRIVRRCKVGIAICPVDERGSLMAYAARLSQKMAVNRPDEGGNIYLDGGMRRQAVEQPSGFHIVPGCDSRSIVGIQLADCCAHAVATILLDEMGIAKRTMAAGDIYDDGRDGDIELGWILWATLRHSLSSGVLVNPNDPFFEDPRHHPFGLELSAACSPLLAEAANKRFGTVWLGCIH